MIRSKPAPEWRNWQTRRTLPRKTVGDSVPFAQPNVETLPLLPFLMNRLPVGSACITPRLWKFRSKPTPLYLLIAGWRPTDDLIGPRWVGATLDRIHPCLPIGVRRVSGGRSEDSHFNNVSASAGNRSSSG